VTDTSKPLVAAAGSFRYAATSGRLTVTGPSATTDCPIVTTIRDGATCLLASYDHPDTLSLKLEPRAVTGSESADAAGLESRKLAAYPQSQAGLEKLRSAVFGGDVKVGTPGMLATRSLRSRKSTEWLRRIGVQPSSSFWATMK